jgi:hypothetical protein
MKTSVMLFLLGINLSLTSCEKSTEPAPLSSVILPLEIGNSWQYARTSARPDSTEPDTTIIMEVWRQDTMDTFIGYSLRNLIIGPVVFFGGPMIFANRSDGLYSAEQSGGVPVAPMPPVSPMPPAPAAPPKIARTLPYPTFDGDTLTYLQYKIKTESTSCTVSVPAGSFQCIQYTVLQYEDTVGMIWCKPDVGLVKTWARYGYAEYAHNLLSYSLQ